MLNAKTHYLQVALNSTLVEARDIIKTLPAEECLLL